VGQLVHQQQLRPPRQRGVDVELLQHMAAIRDLTARQDRQRADLPLGLGAPMRLDHADHDVLAGGLAPPRLFQHLPGLAHAGRRTQEHLQMPMALRRSFGEQGVRVGAVVVAGHGGSL